MEISKPVLGTITAVCIVAGAGGAYLLRVAPSQPQPVAVAAEALTPAVEASEAVVSDPAPAPIPQAAPPAPFRSQKRRLPESGAPAIDRGALAGSAAAAEKPASEPARESYTTPAPVEPVATAPEAPAAPSFDELIVTADSVIGLELETTVTSERARVEDEVVAQVTRDVRVGDRVAIPSGAKAFGEVTMVERGGRMRDRARLGIRFTSIVLADGTRVPIETDTIVREGSSSTGESTAKIGGGALGGAIIGGILGGAKGAIIGGSAGAGAGTAAVLAGGRNHAALASGSPVTVRLVRPVTVTVEK